MRRVDDPRQRLVPPNVLLAFHDQDGPRLHTVNVRGVVNMKALTEEIGNT